MQHPNNITTITRQAIVIAIAVITVKYAISVTTGIPLADEWKWIKELIIPLQQGELSFRDYISGEYAFLGHTHFLTLLGLYANLLISNLDLKYMAYFGLLFYVGGFIAISITTKSDHEYIRPSIILIALIYFNPGTDFPWLLVVFEYTYYLGLIILIILAEKLIQKKISAMLWGSVCFSSAFLLDSFGAVGVIATTIGFALMEKNMVNKIKYMTITLSSYTSGWVLLYILLGKGIGTQTTSKINTALVILQSPYETIQALAISISQPLLDQSIINHYTNNAPAVQFYTSIIGGFFILYALRLGIKSKDTVNFYIPVTFIIAAITAFSLIMITRFGDYGPTEIGARRFTRFYILYYVGAIIIISKSMPKSIPIKLLGLILIISFLNTHLFLHKYKADLKNHFTGIQSTITSNVIDEELISKNLWICKNFYCTDTIHKLRKMNIDWVTKQDQGHTQ